MKKSFLGPVIVVAMLAGIPSAVNAATATSSFQVSVNIQGSCSVQSATNLSFGNRTAIAAALDATSSIGVQCSTTTPYSVGLSAGGGTGATMAARLLTAGSDTIPYTVYRDSNRTQVWGTTATVDTIAGTGDGSVQTYTVYGRIAPVANLVVGNYTDSLSIVVTY